MARAARSYAQRSSAQARVLVGIYQKGTSHWRDSLE